MQRRAAAVYVAFFLVVGAVSFSLIATASAPEFSMENPEYTLQANESFTVNGTDYTVASISAQRSDEGAIDRSGVIRWTNESARFTAEWTNGSTATYENRTWNVSFPAENGTGQFSLVESINRSAILRNDSSVEDQTTTLNGETFVVRNDSGNRTLIPASEYFPEPETQQFQQGDQFQYQGNQTTVATVTNTSATLVWSAPQVNTVNVADEANVTLGGATFLVEFPNNSTIALADGYSQYAAFVTESTEYTNHINGLWGITILSGLSVIFIGALAYLPSRY